LYDGGMQKRELPLEISFVIPVKNEAGNAGPLAAEIHASLSGKLAYEIIFVDDGSTDATISELGALEAADDKVRVMRHRASCGQSQATITGVTAARGTWIATLDGDGQNDPADITKLLAERDKLGEQAARTLIMGRRRLRRDNAARLVASKIANAVRSTLLQDNTQDSGCGIKLLSRDLFLELPRFNALHRFMPALVIRAGGKVVSVPVNHRPRTGGVSKYGILQRGAIGLVDMLGVFWLLRRNTLPDRKI
jgi:dolichol-phosphate mannosyltransferase